jgi:gluconolactonase
VAILNSNQISIYVEGLDHAEGIALGLDGYIYAGSESGLLYRINQLKPEIKVFANTGGFLLGIALDGDNNIYICDSGHAAVQKVNTKGMVKTYSTGCVDEPFIMPNYLVFDKQGNMYISDSGVWKKDNGKIYKIKANGECEVWCRKLKEFPNGLCLDAEEKHLYVVMSLNPPNISRIAINLDGTAGLVDRVVDLPKTVPDGLAFDENNNLYISCYRPDAIYRYTNKNKLEVLAEDYEGTVISAPTNIVFCGENRNMLLGTNLGRWHLTAYHLNITGMSLNYPKMD